jgi:transposase
MEADRTSPADGCPGRQRADDRRVISGIVHVLKSGCRWCDCPPEYGPPTTIYNRFVRWAYSPLFACWARAVNRGEFVCPLGSAVHVTARPR